MTDANLSTLNQSVSFRSWSSLLVQVVEAVEAMQFDQGSAVLTLWANRGGGKTTCLRWMYDELTRNGSVVVLGLWNVATITSAEAKAQIAAAITSAAVDKTKALLFDNIDQLLSEDGEAFFQFEHEIVLPLVSRGDCVLITTSRSKLLQWEECEVRDRHTNWPIPVLNADDLDSLAAQWNLPAERLKVATLGYPQMVGWFHDRPDLSDDMLAEQIVAHFFADLSEPVKELARTICLLPLISVPLLRQVLPKGQLTGDGLYGEVLDHLREMMGAGLIFWDLSSSMYRFSSGAVWLLLAHSRWRLRDADVRRVHEAAAKYFKLGMQQLAYLPYSLIGALYHLSSVNHFDKILASEVTLPWFNENFSRWLGADWLKVWAVWSSGADDPNLATELQSLLGQEVYDEINDRLRLAAQSVEA